MTVSIGIDVGGTNIAAGLVTERDGLVSKRSLPFPRTNDPLASVETMRRLTTELLDAQGLSAADVVSIGLAVPGSIDYEKQSVIDAYNLGYHDFPLATLINASFPQTRVFIENDANAAALAELFYGAFRGKRSGLLITIGTGIGGGLVLDGKIFCGGMKHGFEFGHAPLILGGEPCTCGSSGCIEAYCSASALIREGKKAAKAHPDSLIAKKCANDLDQIDAKLILDAARAGDEAAKAVFQAYTSCLGACVCGAIASFDPEVIAFGGGVSNAGEFLLAPVRAYAKRYAFFHTHAQIVCAETGNDAGIIGAAMLYRQFDR